MSDTKQNILILILFPMIVGFTLWCFDKFHIEDLAREARSKDYQSGHCWDAGFFYGEDRVCIERQKADDNIAIAYTASTNKYSYTAIDFNKSKIIGKWAGHKSKEVLNGWKEGLLKKGKFD